MTTNITELDGFQPELHLFRVEGQTLAVFDTQLACDQKRAPRTVLIKDFSKLALELSGFDKYEDAEGSRVVNGTISLKLDDSDTQLAECQLVIGPIPTNKARGKPEEPVYPSPEDVEYIVRQRMSDALTQAMIRYATVREAPSVSVTAIEASAQPTTRGVAAPVALRPSQAKLQAAANDDKPAWRKYALAAGIPAAVLALAFMAFGGGKKDPLEQAIANAMAQDPKMIEAQVNLTQETLKQMGLDPGKAADLGCLAAQ